MIGKSRPLLLSVVALAGCLLEVDGGSPASALPGAADGFGDRASVDESLAAPPPGLVDLAATAPGVRFDVRYHGSRNFTGAQLPGYGAAGAWLVPAAAAALAAVQADLEAEGLGLLVYDGYRPARASKAMVAWARRTGRPDLVGPYIADRSSHNHGRAVDLTLVRLETGEPLDMGGEFDEFSDRSHTESATGQAHANRLHLRDAMAARGFRPYALEWWHFGFSADGAPSRDVPYGCFEAPEGLFAPPDGWDRPGFELPPAEPPRACADAFVGTSCQSHEDCSRLGGGLCLLAGEAGLCSRGCDNRCPDREGFPVTFCVWSGEILGATVAPGGGALPGGLCVPREEAESGGCSAIPGTRGRTLARYHDPSTVERVCAP